MSKITRDQRKFKFETLQLHVGQEQPDPVTDARAVPIYDFPFPPYHCKCLSLLTAI